MFRKVSHGKLFYDFNLGNNDTQEGITVNTTGSNCLITMVKAAAPTFIARVSRPWPNLSEQNEA